MAEAGLIALAEEIQQRRALREIMIGVGGALVFRVRAPRSRRYSPHAAGAVLGSSRRRPSARRCSASVELVPAGSSASAAISVAWSASNGGAPACKNLVGARDRFVEERRAAARAVRRGFAPTTRTTGWSAGRRRRRPRWRGEESLAMS